MNEVTYYVSGGAPVTERYVYRGEGNAHLALALPDSGRVLRIKKMGPGTSDESDWKRDARFYREIIIPLFGPFVEDAEPVIMLRDEVERLERCLDAIRPASRKHKRLRWDHAALFKDYTALPSQLKAGTTGATYTIEIKPKQGFTLNGKCAFCEKQKLKLVTGKIERVGRYCPVDLFSGDETTMVKAIACLLDDPQNNLQIFKDGVLSYGEKSAKSTLQPLLCEMLGLDNLPGALRSFCQLVRNTLVTNFVDNYNCAGCKHRPLYKMKNNLPYTSVLGRILTLQKCDPYCNLKGSQTEGFQYADHYLNDVTDDPNLCPRCVMRRYLEIRIKLTNREIIDQKFARLHSRNYTIEQLKREALFENDIFGLMEELERLMYTWDSNGELSKNSNLYQAICEKTERERLRNAEVNEEDDFEIIDKEEVSEAMGDYISVPHFISKIAKDCSVMITLRKVINREMETAKQMQHVTVIEGNTFVFDVKVIDLYPKVQRKQDK